MPKHLIFDFDGTLGDTFQFSIQIFNDFAQAKNLKPILKAEISELKNLSLKNFLENRGLSKLNLIQLLKQSHQELNKYLDKIQFFNEIPTILKELKEQNYTLGILSSNSTENINFLLEKNNLRDIFDFVHNSSKLFGKDKSLLKILKKYELPIEETLYIGDELRDLEACQKIKLNCLSVAWGYNSYQALKAKNPLTIQKPEELINAIQNA